MAASSATEVVVAPATSQSTTDEKVKLPFDPEALKDKYVQEREKRLHNGGIDQYRPIEGTLHNWIEDPYVEPGFKREPVEKNVEVLIVGGGYGGQLCAVRLQEQGIKDYLMIEKGGDYGGTWYWNRYPGAQCDIDSYVYMPLLEEVGYIPVEKYSHATELLAHAQAIGKHFDLYRNTLFQTEVLDLKWDDSTALWNIQTSHNDKITARFVIPASGPLHRPKLPGISGIESFTGHSFHSSRWDYDYTGGNTLGGLTKLKDKRVGILGTGATAVQIVPHLADWAKEVFVFQRTPSSIGIRGNKPTDPEWVKTLKSGWQQARMDNFNAILSGSHVDTDLVADGWTAGMRKLRPGPDQLKGGDPAELAKQIQLADFEQMNSIRARVSEIVKDQATADALKPWYNQFCKRPTFHDRYLQSFNQPNVTLVDTQGRGVDRVTPKGIVANDKEYELDCIIYATGFELATDWSHRSGMEITGRNGLTITEKWHDGMKSLHGWTTNGFPNCFFVSGIQAALTSNFMHITNEQAKHIAWVIRQMKERGLRTVEASIDAEEAWVQTIIEKGKERLEFLKQCTPGYYNDEGAITMKLRRNSWYGGGAVAFLEITKKWRDDMKLEGLQVTEVD
ncbi:hypothetical protein Z517_06484 [Fonsecaea pedrosoi CBS 271.37]|uniref:FAD/NAD(P)-binding domain-containing protein n=1 Tax=Fonsecaea pedrosoi CBS 271.37 TaxID=1442368 RepID=A0A0D2H5C1_9EURO|nr:uncharacterized protein Z517_06484 [Fonsecaea pedrosoi CBS 271.37]KIW79869.1 hypothetical protein Z517_06484 [Fonsecaea pedrosoi CBS 271.37]